MIIVNAFVLEKNPMTEDNHLVVLLSMRGFRGGKSERSLLDF
ncbi:hypothetical protein [Brevundimonas variabilis]|uniref:Uncharacterized protein n=1 Tax=Brevundimonas variabilis TaxID=74312 RepID=A0A7W9CKX6_9CAUL|nr:hypothetical protein [Brevundimonas variabilis]MBB5747593.1 hypothetical protein [Brevundimonas variabilis]